MVVASDTQVLGREDELALLREFVSALAQGARAMGIRGEPGIGKTTLWRVAVEVGEAAGLAVLSARCVEAELPLAFVGLSDLVHEAFPAVADGFRITTVLRLPSPSGLKHRRGHAGMRSQCRAGFWRSFVCLREIVQCSSPSMTSSGWTCRHDAPSPSLRDGSATRR